MKSEHSLIVVKVHSERPFQLITLRANGEKPQRFDMSHVSTEFYSRIDSCLESSINQLGIESAKAQNLKAPITTFNRLLNGSFPNSPSKYCDLIYLLLKCNEDFTEIDSLGFIKVGKRNLYLQCNDELRNVENCFSILDFYIREQRLGFGSFLFNEMLNHENIKPKKCAIDRPTDAMLSFLSKNFALKNPLKQHNHFVIFDGFFA